MIKYNLTNKGWLHMNNKEFLGTAPVGGLLFKLALPTLTAQVINMLYNIVDRIFIGRIPEVGDSFEADGLAVEVLEMDGRRIENLHITDIREDEDDED